ncbi:hypothetical protein THF1C08_50164 [Vibrio jasicida]|uniref:Chromosome partitioning protein ParA n=1 Tax=Vibrio jasicida TaxID=766224 RepID=A0AAU9QX72_9VIBR|nr:hypothetical protein THF1C08_50164 [Vibrio jasicida]CAH1601715.1 hypothetical protein THF1A12_50181 [Vibrio jasicida]
MKSKNSINLYYMVIILGFVFVLGGIIAGPYIGDLKAILKLEDDNSQKLKKIEMALREEEEKVAHVNESINAINSGQYDCQAHLNVKYLVTVGSGRAQRDVEVMLLEMLAINKERLSGGLESCKAQVSEQIAMMCEDGRKHNFSSSQDREVGRFSLSYDKYRTLYDFYCYEAKLELSRTYPRPEIQFPSKATKFLSDRTTAIPFDKIEEVKKEQSNKIWLGTTFELPSLTVTTKEREYTWAYGKVEERDSDFEKILNTMSLLL